MSTKVLKKSDIGPILLMALSCLLIAFANGQLSKSLKTTQSASVDDYWLPSVDVVAEDGSTKPGILRLCSLGYERLLADVFWLLFVQYSGDPEVTKIGKYPMCYRYADLVTQLDPHFAQPYWFGCWGIGYWQKRPDLADKILQRGMRYNPDEWYMPFMAGVNQYIFAHNDLAAAKYYERASKLPGAPSYLARHAEILASNIPAEIKRTRTLTGLYNSTTDLNLKESVRQELVALWLKVYKEAPTDRIREVAAKALQEYGVEPPKLVKQ